jgi:TetR/AcrR family transcriptional regulator, transcriptional repressor for nem operon
MTDRSQNVKRGRPPREGTREALLAAGVIEMHERGYNASGVAEITGHARVPKGSFYAQFSSKEVFGAEVVDSYFEIAVLRPLERDLSDRSVPPLARLRASFASRIEACGRDDCDRGCLLGNLALEIADNSTTVRERLARHFATWTDCIAACLAEAQKRGELRTDVSAEKLARFLIAIWEGSLMAMRIEKSVAPLEEALETMFTDVLHPPRKSRE